MPFPSPPSTPEDVMRELAIAMSALSAARDELDSVAGTVAALREPTVIPSALAATLDRILARISDLEGSIRDLRRRVERLTSG
jgi:hypothetical protein